jgi:hypothetical protein
VLGSRFRAGYRSDTPETGRAFPGSYQNLYHARINENPGCPIELREVGLHPKEKMTRTCLVKRLNPNQQNGIFLSPFSTWRAFGK